MNAIVLSPEYYFYIELSCSYNFVSYTASIIHFIFGRKGQCCTLNTHNFEDFNFEPKIMSFCHEPKVHFTAHFMNLKSMLLHILPQNRIFSYCNLNKEEGT